MRAGRSHRSDRPRLVRSAPPELGRARFGCPLLLLASHPNGQRQPNPTARHLPRGSEIGEDQGGGIGIGDDHLGDSSNEEGQYQGSGQDPAGGNSYRKAVERYPHASETESGLVDHWTRTQYSPVQSSLADTVAIGAMGANTSRRPGGDPLPCDRGHRSRARPRPRETNRLPIVDGQGFETGHDARDQIDEDVSFGYVAGCTDDDVVILEKACQVPCRRVCQIGLMHRNSRAKLGLQLRRGAHQSRNSVIRCDRPLRHIPAQGACRPKDQYFRQR
jgi:hypothetical protein